VHLGPRTLGVLAGLMVGLASMAVMPFFMSASQASNDGMGFLCRLYGIHQTAQAAVVKQPAKAPARPQPLTTFGSSPR